MSFPEQLSELLKEWIPSLGGRSVPVSDADIFDQSNMPTLPLAIVGLAGESYSGPLDNLQTVTEVVIEFLLPPEKYTRSDGASTPFWTYYDYVPLRDALFAGLSSLGGVTPVSIEAESDPLAVIIRFRIRRQSRWNACPDASGKCSPATPSPGASITVKSLPKAFFKRSKED